MSIVNEVSELLKAGFSGIWVCTHDVQDASASLIQLIKSCHEEDEEDWLLSCWDVADGYRQFSHSANCWRLPRVRTMDPRTGQEVFVDKKVTDLAEAIPIFVSSATELAEQATYGAAVFVVRNPHLSPPHSEGTVLQLLETEATYARQERRFIICISTRDVLPPELVNQYKVVHHALPDRRRLIEVIKGIDSGDDSKITEEQAEAAADACSGLTEVQASDAVSLSIVRTGDIHLPTVQEQKAQILRSTGDALTLWQGDDSFDQIGGMTALKSFCTKSLANCRADEALMRAKGVMLLGVPGAGKSKFCKALGSETGRPTIILNVGALMGQYVGQSESNTRRCLRIIDAISPCVLMVDELEKALPGKDAHEVSARITGALLTWLQDRTSDTYVVCTCNNIQKLIQAYPEFVRAGRFDGVFFVDLPTVEEKKAIWDIHLKRYEKFGVSPEQSKPDDTLWTGAEIESCVRLAALLQVSLKEAALNVVPVAKTSTTVKELRSWAVNQCLSALHPGLYRGPEHLQKASRAAMSSNGTRKIRAGKLPGTNPENN